MYSRSFSLLGFSSRLPMYSTDFLPVDLAFSIRDQSLSSGAMGFTACGFYSPDFVEVWAHAVALFVC